MFVSAIFMDPRGKNLLDDDEKEKAKSLLSQLWQHIVAKQNEQSTDRSAIEEAQPRDSSCSDASDEEELEVLLNSTDREQKSSQTPRHIMSLLTNYDLEPRLSKSASVLVYWEKKKIAKPELSALAEIALALSVTQVSVERSFSALNFILSRRRANLASDLLEDILLVKLNTNSK